MGKKILKNAIAIFVIAAAVVVCYENSLDGAFVFDDSHYIVENTHVHYFAFDDFIAGVRNIAGYDIFRSLLTLTFAVQYGADGSPDRFEADFRPDPAAFHVVNIALHFFNAVMIFFLVRRLMSWFKPDAKAKRGIYFAALAAALLFATAAVATEGVTYIVGRSNSMCTFFILAALLVFLRARAVQEREMAAEGPRRKSLSWMLALLPGIYLAYTLLGMVKGFQGLYGLVVLVVMVVGWCFWVSYAIMVNKGNIQTKADLLTTAAWILFGLAAVTKQLAVVFPVLALMLDGLVLSGGRRGWLRERWRYHAANLGTLLVGVGLFVIMTLTASALMQTSEGRKFDPAYLATEVSSPVVWNYFGQFLVPTELNFDSPLPVMSAEEASQPGNILTPYLLLLALLFAFTLWIRRRARLFAAGIFWFFICLAPSSSVLRLSDAMDEGRIYLPIIGLCWAIAAAGAWAWPRLRPVPLRAAIVVPLVAIIALNVVNTRQRNEDYVTPERLWLDTINKSPENSRAYEGLGYAFMNRGDTQRRIALHSAKLLGIRKFKSSEHLKDDMNERLDDVRQRRLEALHEALGEQRRNLNAALMLFRAIRDYGEADIPLSAPNGGIPQQLKTSKTHHNLNMGVVYAMRASTLEQVYWLYKEIGIPGPRSELRELMQAARYEGLGVLYESSTFSDPRQPQPLLNYANMCLSTEQFSAKDELGTSDEVRYYADETQQAALRMLKVNPTYVPAVPALLKSSFDLVNYYVERDNKYRQYDCFEKICITLTNLQRYTGRQPFPEELRVAQERRDKLRKELGIP